MNDDEQMSRDLFDRKGVRLVLFIAIPAVLFVLVCAGIRVSQYGIDHTIIVLGQTKLQAGYPGSIRVTLMSDEGGFFLPDTMDGTLVRSGKRHPLFTLDGDLEGFSVGRDFEVPKMSPGPATLELDIGFDGRRRIVRAAVEIAGETGDEVLTIPGDDPADNEESFVEKDSVRLKAFFEDRGLVTGLGSVVFVRAEDRDGKPVSVNFDMEVTLELGNSPGRQPCSTDEVGLFARIVKPRELALPMKIFGAVDPRETEGDAGSRFPKEYAVLFPKVVYGQVVAYVQNPIAQDGAPVRITATQISNGGPAYADVFHRGQWVSALSTWFRGKTATFEYRPKMKGLHRVQLSTSALVPGDSVAVRHFYVLGKDQDFVDGLRDILRELESTSRDKTYAGHVFRRPLERGSGFDRELLGAYALARLYRGHHVLTRLISSRSEDDRELSVFKKQFQRNVMIAIMLLGVGVALMISMMAWQSRRREQRITMMILSDGDEEESGGESWRTDMGESSAKGRILFQGIVLFLIILGAFSSIALLINTLTWSG